MLSSYMNGCRKPSRKCKCSQCQRRRDRSGTMIERLMPFLLNQVTWPWHRPNPTRGREKLRTSGRRNHMKWSAKLLKVSLPTSWKTGGWDAQASSIETEFFHHSQKGDPLCTVVWTEWVRCGTTTLEEQTLKESDTEEAPLSATGPVPDRWDSSSLGKQEALHDPLDVFWILFVGSRVKGSM